MVKKFIFSCLVIFIVLIMQIQSESSAPVKQNTLSFIGVDPGGTGLNSYNYLKPFGDAGINFFGIEQFAWFVVEPAPPVDNKHKYNWKVGDSVIKKIEEENGTSLITLVSSSPWATVSQKRNRIASPPKEEHWDDYGDFVQAVVERYDNDGINDMPGLKYPHLYYQILDEAENRSSWLGSTEEYVKLLKVSYERIKKANTKSVVLCYSVNFADFFDGNSGKNNIEEEKNLKIDFTKKVYKVGNYFDAIALQMNYSYKGFSALIGYIQSLSNKPIWGVDAATSPLLTQHFFQKSAYDKNKFPFYEESEIAKTLQDPSHSDFSKVKKWWEIEKAKETIKKIVVAASLNVRHIFLQMIFDIKDPEYDLMGWLNVGILEDKIPGQIGEPRPVYYSLKVFNEKLSGFQTCIDESVKQGNVAEWIWKIKFIKENQPIYIIWYDGGVKELDFKTNAKSIELTDLILPAGKKNPDTRIIHVQNEMVKIRINEMPIILVEK